MSALLEISSVPATLSNTASTLVFIDSGVEEPQFLANGIVPGAKAFILDRQQDGIKQITAVLHDYPQVESIHLVSHGSPGCIQLGNTYLSLDTLDKYQQDLSSWFSSSPRHPATPSLLVYGCNVAAGDAGEEFINKLYQITSANIAASKTKTGNSALGGDWNLETRKGFSKASPIFQPQTVVSYAGVFGIVNEVEPNDTIETAQILNLADFTLDFDPNIGDQTTNTSESIPHVTIQGTGNDTFDYYQFTISQPDTRAIFDIDFGSNTGATSFDTYLRLFDSNNNQITQNDDNSTSYGQAGSTSGLDSYLEYTFADSGTYFIKVSRYIDNSVPNGSDYQLQLSMPIISGEFTEDAANPFTFDLLSIVTNVDGNALSITEGYTATSNNSDRTFNFTIDEATGEFNINPNQFNDLAENESEAVTVNFEVSNGTETAANTAVFLVDGVNDAPEATAVDGGTTNEDAANPFTFDLLSTATDVDTSDELRVADGSTATSNNGDRTVDFTITNGEFSLDPNQFNDLAAGESETVAVDYEVSDGMEMVENTATFVVEGVNDTPVVSAAVDGGTTNEDAANPFAFDLLSTATDVDGDDLSIAEGYTGTSSNGDRIVAFSIDETTGEFSLNPNQFNDLAEGESETITVNYEVSDNTEMVANTATFVVEGVNDTPVVSAAVDGGTTNEDAANPFAFDLLSTATDVDGDDLSINNGYTATSNNGARTVAFSINETTGEFTLDPNQFNELAVGESETITVNYEVSDGMETVANTASFVVEGANDVPMVETEIEDQITNDVEAFSLDVSSNFSDVDATDPLSFSANGLPDGLEIDAAGMITGTATGGGVYNVTITAEDLAEATVTDTFEMTVQGVITGTAGGDRLGANSDPNQIDGAAGNDNISGFASNDHLIGGEGDDYLKGGTDDDLLEGGAGRDRLLGSKGMDTLSGGADNDLLKGGTQDDMLMGDAGLDRLYGNKGADTFVLQADMGLDTIHDFKLGEDILQLEEGFTGTLDLTESGRNTMINIVAGESETAIALLKGVTDVTLDSLGLTQP